jgi:peptidoglycan/xylan/chitin deacetylase (PgdA/CDA1 family)
VFWHQAVGQQWVRKASYSVGGTASSGYYYYWLYRFGTTSGIAPTDGEALFGDSTVGYYAAELQGKHRTDAAIAPLWTLATGYLPGTATARPVNDWYAPDAHAVVIFSFDAEGDASQNCAVRDVFNKHKATATFNVVGYSIAGIGSCISGFDIQNHTADHPPSNNQWDAPGLFGTMSDAQQQAEIAGNTKALTAAFPKATVNAFRTPWCDSEKSFDNGVARNLITAGITTDSSVPMTMAAAEAATPIPAALRNFSLHDSPSPFVARTDGSKNLVEFPFAYPSDYEAAANGLNPSAADPTGSDTTTAANLWKKIFDQIYAEHGTMVVLMHPWIQTDGNGQTGGLDDLLTYMQSKQGTYISTMSQASAAVRAHYGW